MQRLCTCAPGFSPGKLVAAARALFPEPLSDSDRALGFEPSDFAGEPPPIWPENWPSVAVFVGMGTQWQVAPMGGMVGLRYASLPPVYRACGIKKRQRSAVFLDVQTMERAVLRLLGERQE